MKRFLICLSIIFVSFLLHSQPICQIKEYNVNNGLAQSIVTGILQDKEGLIWLSTWNGLNKFDGYTFTNYKASSKKEHSLTHNRIIYMSETIDGNLWCKTYDRKVYIFDRKKEIFIDVLKPIEAKFRREHLTNKVYSLNNGIAWIICEGGYCFRVDELHYQEEGGIKPYSTFNGDLKGSEILNIYQDSDMDEWIMTDKGVTIIGQKILDNDLPFKLVHEHKGDYYLISTSEKLAYYNSQTNNIKIIDIPYKIDAINFITNFNTDYLALGTNNGVILFNTRLNTFEQIDIRTQTQPSNKALYIYEDKVGDFWVFSDSPGITRINLKKNEKQHLYTPIDEVVNYGRDSRNNVIFEDNQGTLWVMPTKGNFSFYDRNNKKLSTFYSDINNPHSAFSPLIRYCSLDKQGNFWIISSRGVKKMTFYPHIFKLEQPDDIGMETRAFLLDSSNRFWIASKSGYIRIYDENGNLIGYLSPNGKITSDKTKFTANVYSLHEKKNGTLLMGTKNHGLFQLTKKDDLTFTIKTFNHNSKDIYSLGSNDIYSIFTDSQNNTWIGCYKGGLNLMVEDEVGKIKFINYMNELKNYPADSFLKVRTIAEINDSILMVGTTSGLITFSTDFNKPEEIKFYQNKHNKDDKEGLLGSDVMHIYTDSNNNTFVLTFTGAINKVISSNLLSDKIQFKTYNIQDGLASDLVLSMIEDEEKQLWVVTENALSKFDTVNETFENYDRAVLHQDFNFTEAIPTLNKKNHLIFGTDMGFLEVIPSQMKMSDYIPPIIFTDLKIHGKQSYEPINDLEELSLKPSQRNITIHFSALDYNKPENILYAYRLKGLEEGWNNSEKSRMASYINLPAGKYELEVKSTNSDGVWVNNVRSLPIVILPTFWETPWAWIAYFIAFVIFTGSIVYALFYIYRLRHQVDIEQQLSNIKLKFFTDISHELRTPLTLISSPVAEVLENEPISLAVREHLIVVQKNTNRMLRLINQILDFRKIQNEKMKLMIEETEIISFLMTISESFQSVAEEKQINLTVKSNLEELYIWIDKDKIEKVIFNLLSNAFKYTHAKKSITIFVEKNDENVSISVVDEGIGISNDKYNTLFNRFETVGRPKNLEPSTGIGLSLVKELVELHHGDITIDSNVGVGSSFTVTLPLDRNEFNNDKLVELILADSSSNYPQITVESQIEVIHIDDDMNNQTDKLTILIVEDNSELRNLLRVILQKKYTILQACNGEEGLRIAFEVIPDMIISDVMMPIMDGLEMVSSIKANKDVCHIPIILLSAKSALDDRIIALEQGIDDYLTKPFSSTYLKARIDSLFTQRKLLQEKFINQLATNNETTICSSEKSDFSLDPSKPEIISHDKLFIQQIMEYIEEQMDNPDLTIDDFSNKLLLSRSIFYRKLKSITGLSPIDFIREVRIKRAIQLIESESYNFSQVAYMTGFTDPKYFSRCFKKYSGMTPSEYKSSIRG